MARRIENRGVGNWAGLRRGSFANRLKSTAENPAFDSNAIARASVPLARAEINSDFVCLQNSMSASFNSGTS